MSSESQGCQGKPSPSPAHAQHNFEPEKSLTNVNGLLTQLKNVNGSQQHVSGSINKNPID
eukprot:5688782-Heterocapsa_arctica.AAC.1